MPPYRVPSGGLVDRARPLRFSFNGRSMTGFAGDTLASALLANGVQLVARSFKYHRPRGVMASGAEEPNALVQLGLKGQTTPNLKATQVELHDGLQARSVNAWPSVRFDLAAVNQLFAGMIKAGFYYKTFMWPAWRLFEAPIRRAAGLGVAPRARDPDLYDHIHDDCDLLIVGAGPAGVAAALQAGSAGLDVILADAGVDLRHPRLDDGEAAEWARRAVSEMTRAGAVRVLTHTTVQGVFDHNVVVASQMRPADGEGAAQRLWKVRARRVILATGATERPLVFSGNDRPGVMLASAVCDFLTRYGVACGRRAVVATTNDAAYEAALRLDDAGVKVTILDARSQPSGGLHSQAVQRLLPIYRGFTPLRAQGALGVRAVAAAPTNGGRQVSLPCDLLVVSGGYSPNLQLFSQAGGKLQFDADAAAFTPDLQFTGLEVIGAARRPCSIAQAIRQGAETAARIAVDLGRAPTSLHVPPDDGWVYDQEAVWASNGPSGDAFVDFANDVTAGDVQQAADENYVSVEHLKRYTTLGMGPDQGKTSNVNGLAILGLATGRSPDAVGVTKFRPPVDPLTFGAAAGFSVGELYRAPRYLRAHDWHVGRGAAFDEYGGWMRPSAYPLAGETLFEAAHREAKHVRSAVGIMDASPLGKIEVVGKDAGRFLDRMYVGTLSTLRPGRIRYGVILEENGVIIDDGVVVRLSETRFLVHTTSSGAERIAERFEAWLQCEFFNDDVLIVPVTTLWAVATISGPKARAVLQAATGDLDLSEEAFAHMSYMETVIADHPVRIARVSFTGEQSYEISIKAAHSATLLKALAAAGHAFDLAPFGVEALNILRAEKGFLHVGVDTDGTTMPQDVGMAGGVARKSSDFIGRRSLLRAHSNRADRMQFVGLASEVLLPSGSHVLGGSDRDSAGFVTTSLVSPTLNRPIALGLVRAGRSRIGERVTIYDQGRTWSAEIVEPAFYDKSGSRLHG